MSTEYVKKYDSKLNDRLIDLTARQKQLVHNYSLIVMMCEKDNRLPERQARVIVSLILSSLSTLQSMLDLGAKVSLQAKDVCILSRAFFETMLNVASISIDDGARAYRADQHFLQKFHRSSHRKVHLGNWAAEMKSRLKLDVDKSEIEEAISEFSSSSGKEKRGWINKSIDDRILEIEKIDSQAFLLLWGARMQIYRDSSEFLHGTYYGSYISSGANKHPSEQEHYEGLLLVAFSTAILASSAMIMILKKRLNIKKGPDKFAEYLDELQDIVETYYPDVSVQSSTQFATVQRKE